MDKKTIFLNGLKEEEIMSPQQMKNVKGLIGGSTCDPTATVCGGSCTTDHGFPGTCVVAPIMYNLCGCLQN